MKNEDKDTVIELYSTYLEGAGLNHTEWNKIISYDKAHDSFEQMHYRLEAIDSVKLKNPSVDLDQKENQLCATRADKEQMHKIIHNEYYQIERSNEKESSKKAKQEQSMTQQMMM